VTCKFALATGHFNLGTFAGDVLAARSGRDQVIGYMPVTVVVRSVPGLSVRCGTRVARPVMMNALSSQKIGRTGYREADAK
jgi:hypothetical protein